MEQKLVGKTIVVTGATSGIGRATAQALVKQGAAVIGIGRAGERCRQAQAELNRLNPDTQSICLTGDLALQSQVRALAGSIRETLSGQGKTCLDGLVNNAGTFTYWLSLTPEGFETQWAVNHLAAFLLTLELLPLLKAAPCARVVTVSSGSHYGTRLNWEDIQLRRRYDGLRAYSQTKLANVLFTAALNARLAETPSIQAFAVDPGLVKTDIGLKGTSAFVRWIWKARRSGGVPPEIPAGGIVSLFTNPLPVRPGENYWKLGKPKRPSRYALDPDSATRLWRLSEKMVGFSWEAANVQSI